MGLETKIGVGPHEDRRIGEASERNREAARVSVARASVAACYDGVVVTAAQPIDLS